MQNDFGIVEKGANVQVFVIRRRSRGHRLAGICQANLGIVVPALGRCGRGGACCTRHDVQTDVGTDRWRPPPPKLAKNLFRVALLRLEYISNISMQ